MAFNYFITGTDTNVGKTMISVALLKKFNAANYQTIGLKPVAAGGEWQANRCYNEDALVLQQTASIKLPYEVVNPFVYATPAAPFIAAQQIGEILTATAVIERVNSALLIPADCLVVEGAGGWFTPLNAHETMADVVQGLALPVILVVGMRLGCLNHALLTAQAICQTGLSLAGWIANSIDPHFNFLNENINFLKSYLAAPCLGIVGYGQEASERISLPHESEFFKQY